MGAFNIATGLADDPAQVQKDAQANSLAWQKEMFNETQKTMAPWVESGQKNLNMLNNAMAQGGSLDPNTRYKDFKFTPDDPSYQWRVKQGVDAITAAGAAGGNLGSGNLGVALQNFGQNAGSQEYQDAFNRYQSGLNDWMAQRTTNYNMLAGLANPNAAQQMGNFAMNSGVNMGGTMQQGALNTLAGQQMQSNNLQGSMNALGNIGQTLYKNYQQNRMYDQWQNSLAYQHYGVQPVDYGGGGNYQGTDMYAGDLWA